ncbi:MAG: bifunctional alpha,alpha-trehalose-phosphate synthase (UDP-forming)/trehalose-phosphatase [Candidatus Zixiibacteriota bacterium]|nr:MAG: bifunctional alpha,alpha-trehalose-phosphate synthase (UDP-forming)/trehalose-phosphatase [candidate division Zixibacteria bacterium]
MNRLLIVSNRLPVSIQKRKGELHFSRSVGGVATGLASFYESYNSVWIGWPGVSLSEMKGGKSEVEKRLLSEFKCHPVFLSPNDIEKYYHGFSNKTLWPLCHYFTQYAVHDKSFWQAYKRVNRHFCDAVLEIVRPGDIVWVHDYHLMLLPRLLREKLPDLTIGYFHHIPFPSFELFRLLPWRLEILEGLLGADVVGFHTYDYGRHFLSSVHRLLGCEYSMGQVTVGDRIVRVDAFPMGIDYERFSKAGADPEVRREINKFRKKIEDRKVILSIDRLDYTKGIPERLEAFHTFLERNPEYKEKVIFILVAVPSRSQVELYRLLKTQVDELTGKINGEHGTIGWMPIWYLYRLLRFPTLAALYSIADVAVVTPLRDGMNLIAKEYVATKREGKGVLVLSEMAGAAKELGEAIIVNPNDNAEVAGAIEKALDMSEEEQIERNRVMQKRIKRYNVVRWSEEFINRLIYTKRLQKELRAKILTSQMQRKLIADYGKGRRRLLLLDYDGTLVPFYGEPEKAKPGEELLKLLRELAENPKNEVVLISGRYKDTLQKWFGRLDLGLVAEHGVWVKEKEWEMIEPLTNEWKEEIRQILELSTDRTPGSFIEEKDYSLVWHYRKADPELSSMRVRELIDELVNLTANLNLQVLEGSKVVEIKNVGVNKGRAALRWIAKEEWDFLLAVGDDWTDEDLFGAVPEAAYSIKVGLRPSLARFNLETPKSVLSLLKELASKG